MIIGNAVIAAGASSGETETKTVAITENGTQEVTPTAGKTMTKVTVQTNVPTVELLAHTVTFYEADGVTKYAIISVKDGESVSNPTSPASPETGKMFAVWVDSNDNVISFPYTPTADISLRAVFTDILLGTSWKINTPTAAASVRFSNLIFTLTSNDYTIGTKNKVSKLDIGYDSDDEGYDPYPRAGSFVIYHPNKITINDSTFYYWHIGDSDAGKFTLVISGGSGATGAEAISNNQLLNQYCTKVQ